YWANTQANMPSANWNGSGAFDETGWIEGAAKLGYGNDGAVTLIPAGCGTLGAPGTCTPKYTTTYFRKTFNLSSPGDYAGFTIRILRDDGAVVYINGVEVWRSNMPGGVISYTTLASAAVSGTDEYNFYVSPFILNASFLSGDNIIAVEIHQSGATSSDLNFNLQLEGIPASAHEVIYKWSGAVTPTSARVTAKLTIPTTQARLLASTSPALSSPVYGPYGTADGTHNMMVTLEVNGLTPATKYYYAIESNGVVDVSADDVGSFTTSANGVYSFRFTAGGCGISSNHPVYTRMAEKNPDFFVSLGDFHYANPNSGSDINVHRAPYESNMLSQTASSDFFRNVPLAYVWDDHDFSGNDSDSTSVGRINARLAYQEYVPHYPLARGSGNVPIYQSFTIGRVHFILSDLRSTRHQANGVIWDTLQRQWFKAQCLYAKNNNLVIAWVSSVSFGGTQADNWGGFSAERINVSNFLNENQIENFFILSGDAHMLAIDDGTNHDFSTTGNSAHYPVFAVAALNQSGSNKGGRYNVMPDGSIDPNPLANYIYTNPNNTIGQYGMIEVNDNGLEICISFTGYRVTNTGTETQLATFAFCRMQSGALPLTLSSFTASLQNKNDVQLHWTMSDQTGCRDYEIEHSTNGRDFSKLAAMSCQQNTNYSYLHSNVSEKINYYRLRLNELDGSHSFSPVRKIVLENNFSLSIQPNPAKSILNLQVRFNEKSVSQYMIYDAAGREILKGSIALTNGIRNHVLDISQLRRGSYRITMVNEEKKISKGFLVL
ncbi:MAG: alkaline phosphatase D family protein, partial [Flavisolibacter sp.]